jgi:hypothetical protein
MRKLLLAVIALTLAACSGQSYPSSTLPVASSHHHKPATINNVYVLEPNELLRFSAGQNTSTPNETKSLSYTAGISVPTGYGPVYGNALAVSPANGNVAVIHAYADKISVYGSSLGDPLYTITMPHSGDLYAISIAVTYDRYGTLYVAETWCTSPSCYYSGHNAVDEFYGSDTTPDLTWTNVQGWGLTTIADYSDATSGLYVNECNGCNYGSNGPYVGGIVKLCGDVSGVTCISTPINPIDGYDTEAGRVASQIALENATTLAVQYCTNGNIPCTGSHNRIQEYTNLTEAASGWSLNDTFQLCDAYSDLNVPSLTADINGTLYYPCTPENYPSNSEPGVVVERSSTSKYTISSLTPPVIGAGAY